MEVRVDGAKVTAASVKEHMVRPAGQLVLIAGAGLRAWGFRVSGLRVSGFPALGCSVSAFIFCFLASR